MVEEYYSGSGNCEETASCSMVPEGVLTVGLSAVLSLQYSTVRYSLDSQWLQLNEYATHSILQPLYFKIILMITQHNLFPRCKFFQTTGNTRGHMKVPWMVLKQRDCYIVCICMLLCIQCLNCMCFLCVNILYITFDVSLCNKCICK